MFARVGIGLLGIVVLAMLLGIVGLDLWFESTHRPPLGRIIARWSRRYPLFAAGLAGIFGAMLGHFFWP